MHTLPRISLAAAAALVLALTACSSETDGDSAPELGPRSNTATETALTWLDDHEFDLGQQADLYFGLDVLDDDARRDRIADAFAAGVDGYVNTDYEFDGVRYTGVSSGAVAKSLAVATDADLDPAALGPQRVDLVAMLTDRVTTEGPSAGRLSDLALKDGKPDAASNYANSFGQIYAVRGLSEADDPRAAELLPAVTDFLLAQQCDDGWFRLYFNPDADAENQACESADPAEMEPAGDTTALALILLDEVADDNPAVAAALERAEKWLAGLQAPDGSFPGEPAGAPANANSVGLAGWALGVRGDDAAARAAAAWVRALQVTGTACDGAAAPDAGAVAVSVESFDDGVASGIEDDLAWEWIGATVQATPLLAWVAETGTLGLSATEDGADLAITVTGAAPGDRVCVEVAGERSALIAGATEAQGTMSAPGAGSEVRATVGTDTTRATVEAK